MVTLESIEKKLGFDPLLLDQQEDLSEAYEDDSKENPYKDLTLEELKCIREAALKDPRCWITA